MSFSYKLLYLLLIWEIDTFMLMRQNKIKRMSAFVYVKLPYLSYAS